VTRPTSARERARTELTREIKRLALDQLAERGADLSLRAIARELGMVSSALYRYFGSRDELLTALIVDAYADLADALGEADSQAPPDRYAERWLAVTAALRGWALEQPHRFALIYGSPVPGYRAPADTVAPAERVMTAFSGILEAAAAAGALRGLEKLDHPDEPVRGRLGEQLEQVGGLLGPDIPPVTLARLVAAFGQVVGLVNLELAGHFVGGFEPADDLYRNSTAELAATLGLR
jgi:AcrR family transcriptional regulator